MRTPRARASERFTTCAFQFPHVFPVRAVRCISMETAANHRINVPYTSPTTHPRRPNPENVLRVQTHVGFSMRRGGDLTLTVRRASANIIIILNNRFQDPRPFCFHAHNSMAEDAPSKVQPIESKTEGIKNKELEEQSKELPPPPEKPLPGDCCGSGCVRCVWDIYYEELEDYNKLYKSDSNPKSTPS
jgi:hypothetical protein